ncbi:Methyltransferase domain-containing protein [Halogranum gelatinilyticum]|uniref:Methyltransferase domain-containing protein n=1 Tax=Halogranum gelatinilyticum TaxID=660521 RepID=A0A1G9T4B0_9EURY|nr:class I SAM-dependent methyltransferase [Halogranum gelatinilyticum]SDM41895.1 Methyltransferase domain-containing protein [Halogranum gelatinilyticum]
MDDYLSANCAHWDELAELHPETDFYDVESFLAGETTLMDLEREELADVVGGGTDLLHLQCHFGLDTLSWAREGATVTGVDFSPVAIETARELRDEAGIDEERARFVESDVYDISDVLDETFDLVFTSYGVLVWLPDLGRWAEVVSRFLKLGGTFYLAEIHPTFAMSETVGDDDWIQLPYAYSNDEAMSFETDEGSYADEDAELSKTTIYEWNHGVGDIVTALVDAGLDIEFVHEFPKSSYKRLDGMVEGDDGWWRLPDGPEIPMTLSVRATKAE